MVHLTRKTRFAVNPPGAPNPASPNGFAGVPSLAGLGAHYELIITVRGNADPATGYFMDIRSIDAAARTAAIPAITHACHAAPLTHPALVLQCILAPLNAALKQGLHHVSWMLSPTYGVTMSPSAPHSCEMRQRFEIAAAHRLHVPTLSEEENRKLFGKCAGPGGHGHNYIIEPCVSIPLDGAGGAGVSPARIFTLPQLEALVNSTLIEPFDHKNLTTETTQFNPTTGGVNASVENISRIFYELLAPQVKAAGATLKSLTIHETEKTSSTYPG